jgi:hypothetical protein
VGTSRKSEKDLKPHARLEARFFFTLLKQLSCGNEHQTTNPLFKTEN